MKISGKQVTAARNLLGITASELGAAVGVSGRTIERFESGTVEPRRSSFEKILAELGRRGIEFINGVGPGVRLNLAKAADFARASNESVQ